MVIPKIINLVDFEASLNHKALTKLSVKAECIYSKSYTCTK